MCVNTTLREVQRQGEEHYENTVPKEEISQVRAI